MKPPTDGMPVLDFKVRDTYGTLRFYPANLMAEQVCLLVGNATLVKRQIRLLTEMGFILNLKPYDVDLYGTKKTEGDV